MSRVLIVSGDVVDEQMAGPAIRCWEMARSLGREFPTTLAVPNQTSLQGSGFDLVMYNDETLQRLVAQADLAVVFGFLLVLHPFLKDADIPLVVDLYDPFHLENLQLKAGVNVLVFKSVYFGGSWPGSLRFTDKVGNSVKGIKIFLAPPVKRKRPPPVNRKRP